MIPGSLSGMIPPSGRPRTVRVAVHGAIIEYVATLHNWARGYNIDLETLRADALLRRSKLVLHCI
jgi:hypothetical protein